MIITAAGGDAPEGAGILFPASYDLIWGGLSFLIVLVLFWKFVLPRMKKVLAERTEMIEGGIARAEAAQAEAEKAREQYTAALTQAREEAAAIRAQAQSDRAAIVDEARTEARNAAAAVTAQAEAAMAAERAQVSAALTRQVGEVAVTLASKIVGQTLADDARVRATVDEFLDTLEAQASAQTAADSAGQGASA
jgi:F-type H+-transporting ATPase subunit b